MLAIPRREADPGSPYYKPISSALRIREAINNFEHPGGLIRYWNAPKTQKRLLALPESWRRKLGWYFDQKLAALNDAGPR